VNIRRFPSKKVQVETVPDRGEKAACRVSALFSSKNKINKKKSVERLEEAGFL
jgi:hypothetical protein